MKFRIATHTDSENLSHLMELTFRDTYSDFNTPENMNLHSSVNFNSEKIKKELSDTNFQYIVCESENQLIAFAKMVLNNKLKNHEGIKATEIEKFYVKPDFKGQKIGRNLMDFCMNWAKENNFELVWLGVWENNPKAIAFYQKMGFQFCGNHTFLLGNDPQNDFLMKKMTNAES